MRATECPGGSRTRHTLSVVAHPSVVRDARQFIAHRLTAWGMGAMIDRATLVTSELVTNAVTRAGGFAIWVAVSWNFGNPMVEVWDPLGEQLPVRKDAGFKDEEGRGLHLVAELAVRWGVERPATGGKIVWAVL
jgi:anti-sigma regulatory factor (Ser/Thr protein kinase)